MSKKNKVCIYLLMLHILSDKDLYSCYKKFDCFQIIKKIEKLG